MKIVASLTALASVLFLFGMCSPAVSAAAQEDVTAEGFSQCPCVCGQDAAEDSKDSESATFGIDAATDYDVPDTQTGTASAATPHSLTAPIRFSELFPDPVGKDTDGEFIELSNPSPDDADMAGWTIRSASGKSFSILEATLPAGGYLQFPYVETKIVLPNDGTTLSLISPDGETVDSVAYPGPAKEGKTYVRDASSIWRWTSRPTPGFANEFDPPEIVPAVSVDASEGMTETQQATSTDSNLLVNEAEISDTVDDENATATADSSCRGDAIRITEFLPNPHGDDADEWVELENAGDTEACLVGWAVDDIEGGSTPYVFADTAAVVAPGGFLVIRKSESKLSLNNDGDSVRLIKPDGTPAQSVSYAEPPSGKSYALTSAGWQWTEPTPGEPNIANVAPAASSESAQEEMNETESPVEMTTSEAATSEPDMLLSFSGTVTLPPGRIGKTIFYVQDESGGVKVRTYAKDLPVLNFGDLVSIKGRARQAAGKTYVSALTLGGVVKTGASEPKPASLALADITEDEEGVFVGVSGTITKKGSNWIKISDDSGSDEVRINLPVGMPGNAQIGDEAAVTGTVIIRSGQAEIMVMDAGAASFKASPRQKGTTAGSATEPAAPGQVTAKRNRDIPLWPILGVGITIAAIFAAWKRWKPLPLADLPELPQS